MAEYSLQAEDIPTVENIILGEGMPESVARAPDSAYTRLFTVTSDHLL